MARDTTEVLLGPGYMFTAPDGEAMPTLVADEIASDDPGGNWEDVGYSEDGWNLVFDSTYEYFTPAEEVDPVNTIKTAQEVHFRGVAAQFSVENIKIAMGGGTITPDVGPPTRQTYTPPSTDGFEYISVLFRTTGPATGGLVRDIFIPRVISVSSVDIPHTKGANASSVGIDVRAVKKSGSDLFTINELT